MIIIKNLFNKYKEMIMYIIFGVLTTVVNILTYKLCRIILIPKIPSNFIAWITCIIFAYVTNRKYVFKSTAKNSKDIIKEFTSFVSSRIISLIMDMGLLILLTDVLKYNEDLSKIAINILVIIANYILSKLFVFKDKKNK